jgi:hypothetical protein
MALITVLLLVSPVFAKPHVKINDQGLKSLNMRAFIIEEGAPGGHGPKHGRVQALITELEKFNPEDPTMYSYKFMIDLRKAEAGEYRIHMTARLPEMEITIHGSGFGIWNIIKHYAGEFGLDDDPDPRKIVISLTDLNLADRDLEMNTEKVFTVDDRGNYKNVKQNSIEEMVAIDWALDLAWPFLWDYMLQEYPEFDYIIDYVFEVDRDFSHFGIIGWSIPAGDYEFSGGVRFVNTGESSDTVYCTEPTTFTYSTIGFEWWAPGHGP